MTRHLSAHIAVHSLRQCLPGIHHSYFSRYYVSRSWVSSAKTRWAEENIKILTSQVHPIDNNGVPYNFSSTISPMLHNAARALALPARSSQSYLSLFGFSPPQGASMSSSRYSPNSSSSSMPALDDKYTGHILVSGYNVSFVLPREFPARSRLGNTLNDNEATPSYRRRASLSGGNVLQFMAAVEMMVPFVSRPPRAPYLVSYSPSLVRPLLIISS